MSVFNSTVHILHVGCRTSTVPWLAMLHRLREDKYSETRELKCRVNPMPQAAMIPTV